MGGALVALGAHAEIDVDQPAMGQVPRVARLLALAIEGAAHQPAGGTRGMAADIEIEAREILRMRERLVRIISEETGQPVERINKDINRNHWLTADEAIDYGMVAAIIRDPRDIPRD